jgi:ornithine cyclodeaminase
LAKADILVADSVSQCVDHGECLHAVNNNLIEETAILELGHVIKNPNMGRKNDDQIFILDLAGVAIQDILIATMVNRFFEERKQ